MKRALSHSEVSAALDCQTRHAFAYTGQLTDGETLNPKSVAPKLRAGRAWGAAVAAWHEHSRNDTVEGRKYAMERAINAMAQALAIDEAEQREHGVFDQGEFDKLNSHLCDMLGDYIVHAEPIALTRPEHELLVPIPSRTGVRNSTRYQLLCYLDGIHTDRDGRTFLVEFKLRGRFQSFDLILRDRQIRWYAWAYEQLYGVAPAGVIVEERLDETPAPVKLNQDGRPSKVQSCHVADYVEAWRKLPGDPDQEVVDKLTAKDWHRRHTIIFRPDEIDEAGKQLASAGLLIHLLDTGGMYPIRNASPMRCPGCAFKDICQTPDDVDLIDALFDRTTPKRLRAEVPV